MHDAGPRRKLKPFTCRVTIVRFIVPGGGRHEAVDYGEAGSFELRLSGHCAPDRMALRVNSGTCQGRLHQEFRECLLALVRLRWLGPRVRARIVAIVRMDVNMVLAEEVRVKERSPSSPLLC